LKDNVEVILGSVVTEYLGDNELSGIRIKNEKSGEKSELSVDGVFLAVGLIPQNDAFSNILELDERGYAKADADLNGAKDGIFVAGDCRQKKIRQVTTAASDGAVAALSACDYIDSKKF
ncbi:MAG: FAD-dependent oxidoreductase, partial [Clostridia bacterium]|nr:FAD-dependent oxidoreductase [Clostridia bacterium]